MIISKPTKEEAIKAVTEDVSTLLKLSDEMKDDEDIVRAAIKQKDIGYSYASKRLKSSAVFLKRLVDDGYVNAFYYADDSLKQNKDIALLCVQSSGHVLEWVSKELKNDFDVVLQAVQKSGSSLKYASKELKNNETIFKTTIKTNPFAFRHGSEELKNKVEHMYFIYKNCVLDYFQVLHSSSFSNQFISEMESKMQKFIKKHPDSQNFLIKHFFESEQKLLIYKKRDKNKTKFENFNPALVYLISSLNDTSFKFIQTTTKDPDIKKLIKNEIIRRLEKTQNSEPSKKKNRQLTF